MTLRSPEDTQGNRLRGTRPWLPNDQSAKKAIQVPRFPSRERELNKVESVTDGGGGAGPRRVAMPRLTLTGLVPAGRPAPADGAGGARAPRPPLSLPLSLLQLHRPFARDAAASQLLPDGHSTACPDGWEAARPAALDCHCPFSKCAPPHAPDHVQTDEESTKSEKRALPPRARTVWRSGCGHSRNGLLLQKTLLIKKN